MAATSNIFTGSLTPEQIAGTPASIKSTTFTDPLKAEVASPLSSYLSGQVGGGIPLYDKPTVAPYDPGAATGLSAFLAGNGNDNFDANIGNPTIANFRDQLLPDIREGYAGALSSSGRTSAESNAAATLETNLAAQKAKFGLDYATAQADVAGKLQSGQSAPLQAAYQTWLASQSQNNPALKAAFDFLSNSTGTGTTVTTALDPGTSGLYGQIFGAQVAQDALNSAKGVPNGTAFDSSGRVIPLSQALKYSPGGQ